MLPMVNVPASTNARDGERSMAIPMISVGQKTTAATNMA